MTAIFKSLSRSTDVVNAIGDYRRRLLSVRAHHDLSVRGGSVATQLVTWMPSPDAKSPQDCSSGPRSVASGRTFMILVTGGAGFIGSNFVLDWLAQSDEPVLNL